MEQKKFQEILKNRIKERNLTQRKLAELVNSTPPQVNNIIQGREKLGAKNTPKWSEVLAIDPLWLLTQGESGTPPNAADLELPPITTYTARYTWATLALSIDTPIEVISQALGHSYGQAVTLGYIMPDRRKVDAANKKVLDLLK